MDLNHDEDDAETVPVMFAPDVDETLTDSTVELEEVSHIHR